MTRRDFFSVLYCRPISITDKLEMFHFIVDRAVYFQPFAVRLTRYHGEWQYISACRTKIRLVMKGSFDWFSYENMSIILP